MIEIFIRAIPANEKFCGLTIILFIKKVEKKLRKFNYF
jgi:hypothetical protein